MWVFDGETWIEDGARTNQSDERCRERDPLPELQVVEDRPGLAVIPDLPWLSQPRAGRTGR